MKVVASPPLKAGDRFTIAGCFSVWRNPDRRWWQFWKPRWLSSDETQQFEVVDVL